MSTPQNPGDGNTPQDPSDPQNPYGPPTTPPPPPVTPDPTIDTPPPPPAPSTPAPSSPAPSYGDPTPPPSAPPTTPIPAAPSPYGDPAAPPPAAPTPPPTTPPTAPPVYGDPTPPSPPQYPAPTYPEQPVFAQQPSYGQQPVPPYGAAGYPQPGVNSPSAPGKGMAITSLVLSCLCCLSIIGIPLAIVVLVRSRKGEDHGKTLAIISLIVGVLMLVGSIVAVALGVNYANGLSGVNDLKAGDCITAHGLTDKDAESIDTIKTVSCSSKHDGEVLATTDVTADLAKDFSKMDPESTCGPAIESAGKSAILTQDIAVTALTVAKPKTGDNIACVAYNADGSKLTKKLG